MVSTSKALDLMTRPGWLMLGGEGGGVPGAPVLQDPGHGVGTPVCHPVRRQGTDGGRHLLTKIRWYA